MKTAILLLLLLIGFAANLFLGTVNVDAGKVLAILLGDTTGGAETYIILNSRLPSAICAVLGGGALAVAGLMMQTAFRNPLAGPSIMGVNSGASLGVAVVMLFLGGAVSIGSLEIGGQLAVISGALIGGLAVMAIIVVLSRIVQNDLMLLIAAILVGYLASSLIMILNYGASASGVQSYVMWGMGSFSGIPMSRIPVFAIVVVLGLLLSGALVKPLDALLLGDEYAISLGVNIVRVKQLLLLATGVLAAIVTAYCGPIAFIGLAVPHIARFITGTAIHRRLLPATLLTGSVVALFCNIACIIPAAQFTGWTSSPLPLNAVTPIFGVPVILYVLLKK